MKKRGSIFPAVHSALIAAQGALASKENKRGQRMRKSVKSIVISVVISLILFISQLSYSSSTDILKDGLLGAGSGAVGGAASGAKGGDLWKGALAGAATNVVGGALIDTITNKPEPAQPIYSAAPQVQYVDREVIKYVDRPVEVIKEVPVEKIVYVDREPPGLAKKYKDNYMQGYKQAMQDVKNFCGSKL
jgi:hypothetical protein